MLQLLFCQELGEENLMDLFGVLYVPNLLLVILAILISLYLYGRRTIATFSESGLKGPKPTVFTGNFKEIGKAGLRQALSNWKKEFGDSYCFFFGTVPIAVLGDPRDVAEIVVKNFSNFTNRSLVLTAEEYSANMLPSARDGHWKYLRTVLAPSYSSKRMREIVPLIDDVLINFENKIGKIADSKEATDVNILFSGYTMDVIASTGFGIKVDSLENPDNPLVINARKVFDVDFTNSLQALGFIFPVITTILGKLKPELVIGGLAYFIAFCNELVKERKKEKNTSARKDLLQLMLDAQLEGHETLDKKTEQTLKLENVTDWRTKRGLTDVEIVSQCMVFFLAGYETTANTLSFFAHSIAVNPDIQEKLCQEIEQQLGQESPNYDNVQKLTYLDMCLKETLRLYPIATLITRECKEDCMINGIRIPKDSGVIIPVMCLHYDPRYWTDPEKFDPEHFSEENKAKQTPLTYLPFGGGPRICAGMRLAELEFKMAVVQMLRKFRILTCDKTEEKINFGKTGILKPVNGIWLQIEHR